MLRYVASRLPSAAAVLLVASVLIFGLLRLVPGDPATTLAGPDASPEAVEAIRTSLGLDLPVWEQYVAWLGSLLTGDPGRSYLIGGEIGELVTAGLTNTLVLAAAALVLAVAIALVVGIGAVLSRSRWVDTVVTGVTTAALALPPFVTGVLLVLAFAVTLPVLPSGGVPPDGFAARPDITAQYLVLPALCLALPVAGAISRFLVEALRTELGRPYVLTARALGVPRRRIVLAHALPAALPSMLTALGIQVGNLLGGAVLVEAIFTWPGLGQLVEQGISRRDYPVVQVLLLLSVAVFVAVQLVTDILHAALDPRVRIGGNA
ncbi:peptide ABC transporter permease [Pseudonocardia sp. EC080610-09]|jgi:peptide/nickel transport system permease protein|uniref:ABC transporter permease n=1 Tax=unclassified Pseudonocardia TaxID=2619320 RepID=UPI0006CB2BDD|nr:MULTISPECIES: ABC transporter permease [unclassified Pseudonocardia]ALE72868.1 peptide ABC transporter permease [Pseudonocardia sp. EC080625-04]ALL76192.1 peptide ABC transporter permease [Pseudonocardia sp. EC080610-09]ALL83217.1 peptide ABC transporter permease [Pseudonocardia sp. EC080619-01]